MLMLLEILVIALVVNIFYKNNFIRTKALILAKKVRTN